MLGSAQRRHAIGLIALVLLATGGILHWRTNGSSGAMHDLRAACLRIGPLMAAIWLAYPQLRRVPVWLWYTLPVVVLALALRPKWLLVLVPLIAVVAIFMPRVRPGR